MNDLANMKILIVEDDYFVSDWLVRTLRFLGCHYVAEANDGLEAVAMTTQLNPDVIIMDIELPELNGLEASKLIQEKKPSPIVITSAYESRDQVVLAAEVGAGAYLTKPIDAGELERSIYIAVARFGDLVKIRDLNQQLEHTNMGLREAVEHIDTLEGLLPICASCKNVRNSDGDWLPLEKYLCGHTRAQATHGLCPLCLDKLYPE